MGEKVRSDEFEAGDRFELWNGDRYLVISVVASPSGKIINIRAVIESSSDPLLLPGRSMTFGRRAGTMMQRV